MWLKKYIPYFAVAVFYLIVRFFIFRHPTEAAIKYPGDSFLVNIFVMLKALPIYLGMIFYPVNLCMEYRINIPKSVSEPQIIFGLILVIIFVLVSFYCYKKSKSAFFWLMWIPIAFLLTSNILPMQNIVAERYMYLPLIGICVLLALLLEKIGSRHLNAGYGLVGGYYYIIGYNDNYSQLGLEERFCFLPKNTRTGS
ncbi:MAG: hypothetical protein AB1349_05490 [Elusimicrobiota bacterium]